MRIGPETARSGAVELTGGRVGSGAGFSWNSGRLIYQRMRYPITVSAIGVDGPGITKLVARGNVYNLSRPQDFEGIYKSAGSRIIAPAGTTVLQNEKGAVITLDASPVGLRLHVSPEGVVIRFKR
jgi:hypothetical protein